MARRDDEAPVYEPAALTPAERGGFSPTKDEYMGEMLPAYLRAADTAPEVIERYHELNKALERFDMAVAERVAKGGLSKCATIGVFVMGHQWWKRPGQPEWYCMGCGDSVGTQFADLRDGRLWRLDGAMTRDVRGALSKLGKGDASFLSQGVLAQLPAVTLQNMKDASVNLLAQGKIEEAPAPVRELAKLGAPDSLVIPLDQVGDARGFLFKLNKDTIDLCLNCGCAKRAHHSETVAGFGERTLSKLLHCPQLSKDSC